MIVFFVCLGLYILLSYSVTVERYGEKEGVKSLIISTSLLFLSFAVFAINNYLNIGQISNKYSVFVVACGLFNRFLLPRLWKRQDKDEVTSLMRSTMVETWYFDQESGYWFRRSKIVSLWDWAKVNSKDVASFGLENLKVYGKKYHWICVEGGDELPKPYSQQSALMLGRMYEPYKVGPYSKHDNL